MTEVINKQVVGCGFGFFTPGEVRGLSVVNIIAPHSFDSLNQPVKSGLYDKAMGPLDRFETCITCSLGEKYCTGHPGHIDLSVPVYHPLLFDFMYKLMKAKCLYCHKLRATREKLKKFMTKLLFIESGNMQMSLAVDELSGEIRNSLEEVDEATKPGSAKAQAAAKLEEVDEATKPGSAKAQAAAKRKPQTMNLDALYEKAKQSAKAATLTLHEMEVRTALVRSFFSAGMLLPNGRKCGNCGCNSPTLRRDGFTKIFQAPLSKVDVGVNAGKGYFKLEKVLNDKDDEAVAKAILITNEEERLKKKQERQIKRAVEKERKFVIKNDVIRAEEDSEESGDSDDDSNTDEDVGSDGDDDGEGEEADVAKNGESNEDVADADAGIAAPLRMPRLMIPSEIYKHLDLMWKEDGEYLNILWGALSKLPGLATTFRGITAVNQDKASKKDRKNMAANGNVANASSAASARASASDAASPGYEIFFLQVLAVPPSRFRPPRILNGATYANNQNVLYEKILGGSQKIAAVLEERERLDTYIVDAVADGCRNSAVVAAAALRQRRDPTLHAGIAGMEEVVKVWLELQTNVNMLFDSSKTGSVLAKTANTGIKQILEKKEGLFRRNMMGKRVNFAARSVISPDPFIHCEEIGIPEIFARRLTYPEPVNAFNVEKMRQMVVNGPDVYPGANFIEDEVGNKRDLARLSLEQRQAVANTLLTTTTESKASSKGGSGSGAGGHGKSSGSVGVFGQVKKVLRHVVSGDAMIVNRQPTLHKPSMMVHKARVLKQQSTIRMHYANCSTYNADFDGDEINLHLLQNELARAEGYEIANTNNQYCVPTSGNPLRGLIQDSVVAGVKITKKDSFYTKAEFQQLMYMAFCDIKHHVVLETPVPCILKPTPLWSGKQIVSVLLKYINLGKQPLSLVAKAKLPASAWKGGLQDESTVIIRHNQLLVGVLDSAQFGKAKFGMVHACYELYGPESAGDMLTTLSRMFTRLLQHEGFTCGMDDLLLLDHAELERKKILRQATEAGVQAAAQFAGLSWSPDLMDTNAVNLALQRKFKQAGPGQGQDACGEALDGAMKAALNDYTSSVIKACLPHGQYKSFPWNNMSMMTLSGAKGSMVNFSQISCLLGQQELEGRRVPVMPSGKSLPSFRKYDPSPRAGGYVAQRFLTGINPQEYYFHCMAGREGLVDTAVKTSRSGYLQRCLVKHLESLTVHYDQTVRDVDGSVLQFHYGEDSIDVMRNAYLENFSFLADNYHPLLQKLKPGDALRALDVVKVEEAAASRRIEEYRRKAAVDAGMLMVEKCELAVQKAAKVFDKAAKEAKGKAKGSGDKEMAQAKLTQDQQALSQAVSSLREASEAASAGFDPVLSSFSPSTYLGAVSDRFSLKVEDYISRDPDGIFQRSQRTIAAAQKAQTQAVAAKDKGNGKSSSMVDRTAAAAAAVVTAASVASLQDAAKKAITAEKFRLLMNVNYCKSMVPPGEAVGVLAAQGVGEPSTQMTLNTFHLAGHGGANVTLGIPRLREIIMTASAHIKTPIMEFPLLPRYDDAAAVTVAARLNRLRLSDLIEKIEVRQSSSRSSRVYLVRVSLVDLANERVQRDFVATAGLVKTAVGVGLTRQLQRAVAKELKSRGGKRGPDKDGAELEVGQVEGGYVGAAPVARGMSGRGREDGQEGRGGNSDVEGDGSDDDGREDKRDADDSSRMKRRLKKKQEKKEKKKTDGKILLNRKHAHAMPGSEEEGVQEGSRVGKKKEFASYGEASDDEMEAIAEEEEDSDSNNDSDSDSDNHSGKESEAESSGDDEEKKDGTAAAAHKKQAQVDAVRSVIDDFVSKCLAIRRVTFSDEVEIEDKEDKEEEEMGVGESKSEPPGSTPLRWAEVEVWVPIDAKKMQMLSLAEKAARVVLVRFTPGINKVVVLKRPVSQGGGTYIQTDGVNFNAVWSQPEVDTSMLKCNDVSAILRTYGVEAARAAIMNEVSGVFAVYGIAIDKRHLSVLADYMTYQGGYKPFNRAGINNQPAPFQKISFETSMGFMLDACIRGDGDDMKSPSARIVLGQPIKAGSGAFDVLQPLHRRK